MDSFDVVGCHRCAISYHVKNYVLGRGNDKTPVILFVGEAPGVQEDFIGESFRGSAGKILDTQLNRIGLPENSYYIANVIKCRPFDENGKNRKPTDEEITNCIGYLEQQIQILKPKIIVALGIVAKNAVRSLKLSPEIIIIETLHPAATIYKRDRMGEFIESFDYLKSILNSLSGDGAFEKRNDSVRTP